MKIVTFVELTIDEYNVFLFGYASEETELDYGHIPSLTSVRVSPAVIDPGVSIGERERVTVSLIDHLYTFDTDSFNAGTFWTKFRARYESIEGAQLKLIRGEEGQAIEDMDTYLYVAQSLQISRTGATITAKDPLILLDGRAAQAPNVNTGELLAGITAGDGALTLTPAGIGNIEYPSSGKAVISGSELVSFTRTGDSVTLTTRGENRDAEAHDAGAKFQLALVYDNEQPSAIVSDLLVNYTGVSAAWITIADWQASVDAFIDRVYSATIATPTGVRELLDEICEQIGLVFFWDAFAKQIRLRPLLAQSPTRTIDQDAIREDSFTAKEQPDKRVSQIWTFYGQRDPVVELSDRDNYRRVAVKISPNAASFDQPAIKKIFSRWINFPARTTAERLNDIIISRYQIPPRKFKFDLFRSGDEFNLPASGEQLNLEHWFLVDADGDIVTVPAQVTSAAHDDDGTAYEAEEVRFAGGDDLLDDEEYKYVFIDGDQFNINLRDQYDQIYTAPNENDQVIFVVSSDARVGGAVSTNGGVDVPAMDVGAWPEPVDLVLVIDGRVQGIGGQGGGNDHVNGNGHEGGTALFTRRAITVENNGKLYGGAGGGGLSTRVFNIIVGGGGAGFVGGPIGTSGFPTYGAEPGSPDARGQGGFLDGVSAGDGGAPGQVGQNGNQGTGGQPGNAVDGDSFVTYAIAGDIRGPQVN